MVYKCEKCDREFTCKRNLEYHQNRKIPCTEQIIKNGELKCSICEKEFKTHGGLYYHVKNKLCKIDNKIIENNNIEQQNVQNNQNNIDTKIEVEQMNVDGDVKVVKFGDENLSYISDDTFRKIIGRGFKSLEEFMNHVHFNKDHPENHNIYVASLKDGHVITYDGARWNVGIAEQVLEDLIQQKSDILEDKYDEMADKLSPIESKKFNNFINRKDDAKVNLKLKRELRVQLYNNRHFAKGVKKLLEKREKLIENGVKIEPMSKDDNDDTKLNQIMNGLKELPEDRLDEILVILNKQ